MTLKDGFHHGIWRREGRIRKAFILLSSCFFLGGCADSHVEPPLADSTMVDIMIDLHLAIARAEVTQQVPPSIRDSIFASYDVDSSTYAQTIWHYAQHPEKYEQIYGQVLDQLNSERIPLGPPDPTLSADEADTVTQRDGRPPIR